MPADPGANKRISTDEVRAGGPPNLRRSSVTSVIPPQTRHVGFHVEGVPPSPANQTAILAHDHVNASTAAGSPTPAIIPPSFQV